MTNEAGSPARHRAFDFSIENWLAHRISDHWCGNDTIPGTTKRFEFSEKTWPDVAVTNCNDGFDLWIGTMDEWHTNFSRRDAHRLACWILWDWWGKGEWFGLKRALWYKLLTRRVERWRKNMPA